MFADNPFDNPSEGIVQTGFASTTQLSYHSNIFRTSPDWNLYDLEALQNPQAFTSSPSQENHSAIGFVESPTSSSDGYPSPNLLRKASFTGQDEKRRAANRNSQRAFRKRQASYIVTLESELKELRIKYQNLLKLFTQIKQAVDLVGLEVCEVDNEDRSSCTVTAKASGDEKFHIPDWR